jgi:hypothetical protein
MAALGLFFNVGTDCLQQQCQRERTVNEQIAVSFDFPSIVSVEMNQVGVECQRGVAEQK